MVIDRARMNRINFDLLGRHLPTSNAFMLLYYFSITQQCCGIGRGSALMNLMPNLIEINSIDPNTRDFQVERPRKTKRHTSYTYHIFILTECVITVPKTMYMVHVPSTFQALIGHSNPSLQNARWYSPPNGRHTWCDYLSHSHSEPHTVWERISAATDLWLDPCCWLLD